jgi:hypothetical protein
MQLFGEEHILPNVCFPEEQSVFKIMTRLSFNRNFISVNVKHRHISRHLKAYFTQYLLPRRAVSIENHDQTDLSTETLYQ